MTDSNVQYVFREGFDQLRFVPLLRYHSVHWPSLGTYKLGTLSGEGKTIEDAPSRVTRHFRPCHRCITQTTAN